MLLPLLGSAEAMKFIMLFCSFVAVTEFESVLGGHVESKQTRACGTLR